MMFHICILLFLPFIFLMQSFAEEYALQEVGASEAKSLASIRFENASNHLCLGVILGRRTIMTSASCINSYIPIFGMLQNDFEIGKCLVFLNARRENNNNNTNSTVEERLCKKFEMNNQTWWSYGKQMFYDYPVNILVDLPLDKTKTSRMAMSEPKLEGFDLCEVYGWGILPHGGNSTKVLLSTVAMLMDQYKCMDMYKERISQDLPENQFCVIESRITDEGRIVVCDRMLLGIFSRKMPILHGNEESDVNLYTFVSSGQRSNLPKNLFLNYINFVIIIIIISSIL